MMPSGISEFLEPSDISEFLEPTGLEVAPPLLPSGPYTNAFLFNAVEDDDSSGGGSSPGHHSSHSYDLSSDGADDLVDQMGVGDGDLMSLASHSTTMSENTKTAFGVGGDGVARAAQHTPDAISLASSTQYDQQYDQQPATNPFAQYTSVNPEAGAGAGAGSNNELAEVCIEFGAESLERGRSSSSKKLKKKLSKKQSKKKGGNVSIQIKSEPGAFGQQQHHHLEHGGVGMAGGYNASAAGSQYDTVVPQAPLHTAVGGAGAGAGAGGGGANSTSVVPRVGSRSSAATATAAQLAAAVAAGAVASADTRDATSSLAPSAGLQPSSSSSSSSISTGGGFKKRKASLIVHHQESGSSSSSSAGSSPVYSGGAPAGAASSGLGLSKHGAGGGGGRGGGGGSVATQLVWTPHFQQQWHGVLDEYSRPVSNFQFKVRSDKGFTYSAVDTAFVCQRKNHFQMTVTMDMLDRPRFAQLSPGRMLQPIREVFLCVHGVKSENGSAAIPIEQAQVDRSKCVLQPVRVQLTEGTKSKITLARLHFSETTANNMRKKGKPNPEQRYFNLVVSVVANLEGTNVTLSSVKSPDIIVRASNLGQFAEVDTEGHWAKAQGGGSKAIVHMGNVGINTKSPHEALSVHGNVQVTGSVLQPSDGRLKNNFRPLDSKRQLDNVRRLTLYDYDLKDSWTAVSGRKGEHISEAGVIAQQVQAILPDAVRPTHTNVTLANGKVVDNLLMVNKERIFMENVGAVQELCRMTENLENRIKEIEALNVAVKGLGKESDSESEADAWRASGYNGGNARRGAQMQQFPVLRTLVYCGLVVFLFAVVAIGIIFAAKDAIGPPPDSMTLADTATTIGTALDPYFVPERPCLVLSTNGRCGPRHGSTACRNSEYQNWHCSDNGWCGPDIHNGHENSEFDFNRACPTD